MKDIPTSKIAPATSPQIRAMGDAMRITRATETADSTRKITDL